MSAPLVIPLKATPEQVARLRALQQAFAEVCNALAPVVRDTRCWNRVALHHMTYRSLRDQFPQIGSQMVCNAIYSVSRASRMLYQSPGSPFSLARLGGRPLPLMKFSPTAPVYFDRHTLSIKAGHLSMYTMDGRMRFVLDLSADNERRFHGEKLYETVLVSRGDQFRLQFIFGSRDSATPATDPAAGAELPEHVLVLPEAAAPLSGDSP